jgi:phenylacetate-coenzyme A ligase PaaK-like adenylate-forming protein
VTDSRVMESDVVHHRVAPHMMPHVMHLTAALARFARTRWGFGPHGRSRAALLAWQERRLREFLRHRLTRAPFYAEIAGRKIAAGRGAIGDIPEITLADLPIVDKQTLLTHFDALNTRDIRYGDAMAVALAAERSRDFRPELGDVTVGLSSGTSGQRVPFLVSARERMLWASSILARMLDTASLARIASPWQPPLDIAFFLRANSNLYTTLDSRRVTFAFYDLLQPIDTHIDALMSRTSRREREKHGRRGSKVSSSTAPSPSTTGPDVLVAPATVLRRLADLQLEGRLRLTPRQVISVAETLEQEDAAAIARAFGCRVQQIYQATEGFLGYTCPEGTLHLNEECVHIEPEWLDDARTRFHPIVTDFTRETQMIARYRLDDVLRVRETSCPCGRASLALAGIDGRRDAVLMLPSHGAARAIFPDVLRRAMMLASGDRIRDYRIVQTDDGLVVRLDMSGGRGDPHAVAQAEAAVRAELDSLFAHQGVAVPPIAFAPWQPEAAGDKCCRIRAASTGSSRSVSPVPKAIA